MSEPLEQAAAFSNVPDAFQRLWVPHRMAYINEDAADRRGDGCPFCAAPNKSDADGLIVHRGKTAYVLLNLFPYNSGHLLVCPYRHIPAYDQATDEEAAEIAALTQTAMRVLRSTTNCQGFNIGMNQGSAAGAGVDEHLHQHIVPRWSGDVNFMPIIANVKPLPQLLGDQREQLMAAWGA